jgi:hypothetical protein
MSPCFFDEEETRERERVSKVVLPALGQSATLPLPTLTLLDALSRRRWTRIAVEDYQRSRQPPLPVNSEGSSAKTVPLLCSLPSARTARLGSLESVLGEREGQ